MIDAVILVESYIYFRAIDLEDVMFIISLQSSNCCRVTFKDIWGLYSHRFYIYKEEFCIY